MFIAPSQGRGHLIEMMRTHEAHYDINKKQGPLNNEQEENFSTMVFRAMQGVNQDQKTSMDLYQQMILDPDSVDVHDVSIAIR